MLIEVKIVPNPWGGENRVWNKDEWTFKMLVKFCFFYLGSSCTDRFGL